MPVLGQVIVVFQQVTDQLAGDDISDLLDVDDDACGFSGRERLTSSPA